MPTRYAWCDIDGGVVRDFRPQPTILVETSPGRHQGLWEFTAAVSPRRAEGVSRHFTYTHGGDHNGWSCTKMLRLPFTYNHKPQYDRPAVKLLRYGPPLSTWPDVEELKTTPISAVEVSHDRHDPAEVVQRYRSKIPYRYVSLMRHTAVLSRDRSRCIFMIVAALHDAGASLDEIASVVWRSPYFVSKHGHDETILAEEIHRIIGKIS